MFIIINIYMWSTLLINFIESSLKLGRSSHEFFMTCFILLVTMSIGYPQSIYFYIGSGVILFLAFLFIGTRQHNLNKVDALSKKYEKMFGEVISEAKKSLEEKNKDDEEV